MDAKRWAAIESLYRAALEREPGERAFYLANACPEDPALRREVESLMAYADATLESPVQRPKMTTLSETMGVGAPRAAATLRPIDQALPATIGRYRILRLVGEGGMGAVYEAEQEQPRRTVALKVIRPGLTGPELLRRFEQESQALARLQHPGIAQIYEAGYADSGSGPQPYFAMEFIRGPSLLAYAQAHQLSTRERLGVMVKICEAVQHAHQRGIIHRDLKPGNILVAETGQPKVLDLGVARVTDCDTKATQRTDLGQIVGTLTYMSPEQALGDPLELDTRSDVYSLGVILYELLSGRLPYAISSKLHEALRTIREEDPAPLTAVSRSYRGDIETIVSKALEKDKARRYSSATELAQDIGRYLKDEPISARSPSAAYQVGKFVRRHQALVAGLAAVFLVLIAGISVSSWEAARARRAEQTALTESAAAKAVNDFLQNDLLAQAGASAQAHPDTRPDPDLKVLTALGRAAARVAAKFGQQPAVEASIRHTIGRTYMDLGLLPEARRQLEDALRLRRGVFGEEHPDTARSMYELGGISMLQGRYSEAESLFAQALQVQRRALGEGHPDTLNTIRELGSAYESQGRYGQAESLYKEALKRQRRTLGEEHPYVLNTTSNLAGLYRLERKHSEAETLYENILKVQRRVLGEAHPDTLTVMNNLATVYGYEGKFEQSEALQTEVVNARIRAQGGEHPLALSEMCNLAVTYRDEGKYTQAEALLHKTLQIQQRVLGEENPDTLDTKEALAVLYRIQGRHAQAATLFREVLGVRRRTQGEEAPDTLFTMGNLGLLYRRQGRYEEAEALFTKELEARRRLAGTQHPTTTPVLVMLGELMLDRQRYSEAETRLREALLRYEKALPDDWRRFRTESMLGASLAGQAKYADAEPLLIDGYKGLLQRQATMTAENRDTPKQAGRWLIKLYQDSGKPEKAAEWRQKIQKLN